MSKLRSLCAAASASAMVFCAINAAQAAPVSGQGTWETTLQARDINGDGVVDAFYDTVLNVTWLADAKAAAGSLFDNGVSDTDGRMTWASANAWTANLNVYGLSGWRLPTMIDTGSPGCTFSYNGTDCGHNVQTISADGLTVYSEMAHLYYITLGNKSSCDTSGDCSTGRMFSLPDLMLSNTGALRNLEVWVYWSGVAYATNPSFEAWTFYTGYGNQFNFTQDYEMNALAVRPGDVVTAVPEPQTWAFMLLGLAAMVVVQRKRAIRRFDTSVDLAV